MRRDAMTPEERAAASEAIAVRATAELATLRVGDTVALYAPKGTEVDTAPIDAILRDRGIVVAYPRVVEGQRALAFHAVHPSELTIARFGLREPRADHPAVGRIDAFLVPGLAFDRTGGRIGWGHGHYDATLALVPGALRFGLAFECQLVTDVPREPHDIRLHAVFTEHARYPA